MTWKYYLSEVLAHEIRVLMYIGIACLLLATTGVSWVGLVILALTSFTLYHLWQGKLLLEWVSIDHREAPPDEVRGIWNLLATRMHKTNKAHRQQDAKSRQLINQFIKVSMAMPDGIVIVDDKGRIEWFNETAIRLLGLRKVQDRGSHIINLIRDPAFIAFIDKDNTSESLRMDSSVDPDVKLDLRLTRYNDKRLLIIQDFSALDHMEQVRKDFVANVSHELRTPLSVIAGYLETLNDEEAPELEPYQPIFWQMKDQSDRMTRLVEDLLILSNLESNQTISNRTPVDVPGMLKGICDDAIILSGSKNHDIHLEVSSDKFLSGNPSELHGVFSNLVSNAVNYTPELGAIYIRWYSSGGKLIMEVSDTGIGIEPQHINRLTERFYRADKGRSRSVGGTGLGLAIAKHALQRHDGVLKISSVPGQGSTFKCIFPPERALDNTFNSSSADSILEDD
ncbi:phosphate regulon sensor histidine kinase PhoR [Leucothrix mucor]|uniref:phosphate regulon sensor histidine kinase PhoR n=1 Tax=Leucothrix mucor TaxID=45248 RepID=UPI0003B5A0C1|nr:phosphate regulon sensor histidine kinase PhoR [Leucothrix mucor]